MMTGQSMVSLAVAALLIGGCQTARVVLPLTDSLSGNDPDTQLEFWHSLADRPVISNDEAFHAIQLFLEGNDAGVNYAQRVASLQSRGLLAKDFDRPANEAVVCGVLAVVWVQALDIKGGVVMRTIGPTERYAVYELRHLGIYPPCDPHQTFTGGEFIDLMGRVEDYQARAKPKTPASSISIGEKS
jgi:hypothetical protein